MLLLGPFVRAVSLARHSARNFTIWWPTDKTRLQPLLETTPRRSLVTGRLIDTTLTVVQHCIIVIYIFFS